MKKAEVEMKKKCSPPPPPSLPPPPLPVLNIWSPKLVKVACKSITRDEIERYWRRKKMEEEDHLLSALKTAARIRARNLTEEDYKQFEESLENEDKKDESKDDNTKSMRVGIKDWWTKSKYAYLNQPTFQSMDKPKGTSTYIPNMCFYKSPPSQSHSFMGFYLF